MRLDTSPVQRARLAQWLRSNVAEPVEVDEIGGVIYAFGSELATLRLLKLYRTCENVQHGYSSNLDKWYIAIE